jgi:AmmeMemoRadiSam system protein B
MLMMYKLVPRRLLVCMALAQLGMPLMARGENAAPFRAMFPKSAVFEEALKAVPQVRDPVMARVTGIVVPHHLVGVDLIVAAFEAAKHGDYDRLILLSPDHFKLASRPFATTRRGFETALGPIQPDAEAAVALLKACPLVEDSDVFEREHGVQAILPIAARYFPKAKLLPVTLRIDSREEDWHELIKALKPLVTGRTLIVQSTDYSHYLPSDQAALRDQETLNVLSVGSTAGVPALTQPDHFDSRASQFVHMTLQWDLHHAKPTVIANRNAREFRTWPGGPTTSYIVQVYHAESDAPGAITPGVMPALPGDEIFLFAGDTFFGRYMAASLASEDHAKRLRKRILSITRDAPLIVNLEGVMLSELPVESPPRILDMPAALTAEWLRALNVKMVSLANNHSADRGREALDAMHAQLTSLGITALRHGESADLGPIRVTALTDLCNQPAPQSKIITMDEIAALASRQDKLPHFAFLHWGREQETTPGPRETSLMNALRLSGMSAVVGAHPHVASDAITMVGGNSMLCAYSLGNFLFDHPGAKASGALLEVRVFSQGTYSLRLHHLGNLYDGIKADDAE